MKSSTIEKDLKKLGLKNKTSQIYSLPGETAHFPNIPICSNLAVISLLKSILCSLDAILQKEKKELFTRTQEMKPIIDFVRESISAKEEAININSLDHHYLGIQLVDQKTFEKCLSFHHYCPKAFEHVIIFSSNIATKTLDAAWNIFSHEIHGVRLADNWSGPKVCGFISNPIFKDEETSHAICFGDENPFLRLQKTNIKCFGSLIISEHISLLQTDYIYYPVLFRQQAYYDAICYIETNNDILIESFRENSKHTNQTTLLEVLTARIKWLFKDSYKDDLEQILETIEKKYEVWENQAVSILFDDTDPLLRGFINDYKEAFSSLVQAFYPPSKIVHRVSCEIKPAK